MKFIHLCVIASRHRGVGCSRHSGGTGNKLELRSQNEDAVLISLTPRNGLELIIYYLLSSQFSALDTN